MILAAFLVLRLVVQRGCKVDLSRGFKKDKINLPIILPLVSMINPIDSCLYHLPSVICYMTLYGELRHSNA